MLTLPKHNRYDYSVIGERKDYSWPDGKRLAFCATTNIEVYAYRKGTGWDPAKKGRAAAASATTPGATMATGSASGGCSTCSTS